MKALGSCEFITRCEPCPNCTAKILPHSRASSRSFEAYYREPDGNGVIQHLVMEVRSARRRAMQDLTLCVCACRPISTWRVVSSWRICC
jgi:hypothetical protein